MYDISDSEWRQMIFFSVEDDFFFVADDFFLVADDFFLVADDDQSHDFCVKRGRCCCCRDNFSDEMAKHCYIALVFSTVHF